MMELGPRDLTFDHLAAINKSRCRRWHSEDSIDWIGSDWSNAMDATQLLYDVRCFTSLTTETGTEVRGRGSPSEDQLVGMLAHEIADTILYAFLLADHYGINVEQAVVEKFNKVSERQGFPERLP